MFPIDLEVMEAKYRLLSNPRREHYNITTMIISQMNTKETRMGTIGNIMAITIIKVGKKGHITLKAEMIEINTITTTTITIGEMIGT